MLSFPTVGNVFQRTRATPVPLTSEALDRLRAVKLDGVLRHVIRAGVINSTLAAILAIFLAPVFGPGATATWLGVKLLVSACRMLAAWAMSRRGLLDSRYEAKRRITLALLVVDGAVWGAAGAWCSFGSSEIACLACAVLCSVALMSTHGFTTMSAASTAYSPAMLGPLAVAAMCRGDAMGGFVSVGSILVLVQTVVTGVAFESRFRREFISHEATEAARAREAAHSEALAVALREVRKQAAVKALFLGTMSHELRTPLHGILGVTKLVRAEVPQNPVVQHHLDLVESSGVHLLELISSLLDVSRIESGHLELHKADFDLYSELETLADLYRVRCESKGLQFEPALHLEPGRLVSGDAGRVRQVLHNLLGNAVKFTKSGFVTFRVVRTGDMYSFEIRDTGPGIASKDVTRIFDAFGQADDSATRPTDGAGLGLTIARELASAMDGDISVQSALGVGSRFVFTARLPFAILAPIDTPEKEDAVESVPQLRAGYRVLIAEDNDVNALIATANLTHFGAQVERVVDGREAVSAAMRSPRPEFIFLDCRMPVMDGPSAAREIRSLERERNMSEVPIVALTASPTEDVRKECEDAGMNGFLAKPFTPQQLLQTISIYAEAEMCDASHPLYEYAQSLEDSDFTDFGSLAVH